MLEPTQPIELSMATDLQFDLIKWLQKLQELLQSHMKIYQETFDDLNHLTNDFTSGYNLINGRITDHMRSYGLRILSYLLILDKKSGLTLFEKNLGDLQINPDLVGGFLQALQSFGMELAPSETSMKTISYENYQFQIESGEYIRAALIIRGKPNEFLVTKLPLFVKKFEDAFKEHLVIFTGNMAVFNGATELFETVFKRND
jgi:hypothetical protein